MATDNSLLEFFTKIGEGGGVIAREQPKLDLDQYIANYTGRTRFDRLFLIGTTSVPLCVDALKAAVVEAKRGKDIFRYRQAREALRTAAPREPEGQPDASWVSETEGENKATAAKLEAQLKQYRHNLVKESIRMGNEDLGLHFESVGALRTALEYYGQMRQDVSTTEQLVKVTKHLIRVSLQLGDWAAVLVHISKLHGIQLGDKAEDEALQRHLRIARGIAALQQGTFEESARCFLHLEGSPSSLEKEMATLNDVAVYGALSALATFERGALQAKVLDNQNFRSSLELEPHLRKAVSFYVSGRYAAALEILEAYRTDFLLDLYLQKFVPSLLQKIRSKCIIQYFAPYSCVSIDTMKTAFGLAGESLEEELREMISQGVLKARINTIDRLMTAVETDPRVEMQKTALEMAQNYEKQALERIRRIGIAAADLESKGVRKGMAPTHGIHASEAWFDESASDQMVA